MGVKVASPPASPLSTPSCELRRWIPVKLWTCVAAVKAAAAGKAPLMGPVSRRPIKRLTGLFFTEQLYNTDAFISRGFNSSSKAKCNSHSGIYFVGFFLFRPAYYKDLNESKNPTIVLNRNIVNNLVQNSKKKKPTVFSFATVFNSPFLKTQKSPKRTHTHTHGHALRRLKNTC